MGTKTKEGYRCALFDISAASIGVALGSVNADGARRIDWSKRIPFNTLEERAYSEYVKHCYAALMQAATTLSQEGMRAVPEGTYTARNLTVLARLSPPWMFGAPITAETKQSERTTVTHSILDKLRANAYEQVLALPEYTRWQEVVGSSVPVEQCDQILALDGYHVTPGRSYVATTIELLHYVAFASPEVMEHIEEILHTAFPHSEVRFGTSTRCFAQNLAPAPETLDARSLCIEVGGHTTTVSVVEEGVVHSTSALPEGLHDILRAAAPKAVSRLEAESALEQTVPTADAEWETVPEPVRNELSEWHKGLQEAIKRATRGSTPPLDTYLIVDQRYYPLFEHAAQMPWKQHGIRTLRSLVVHPYAIADSRIHEAGSNAHDMRLIALLDPVDETTLH